MMYGSSLLDQVLEIATITDVLDFAGIDYPSNPKQNLLCPIHEDHTPSFSIQKSGKGYKCHACSAHGGILDLMIALDENQDKASAVQALATHLGITADESVKPRGVGRRRKRSFEALKFTESPIQETFTSEAYAQLCQAYSGYTPLDESPGVEYLQARGFDTHTIANYRICFHPHWLSAGPAVVFGIVDQQEQYVAALGRYISSASDPKCRIFGKASLGVFPTFSMSANDIQDLRTPIAITEGPFDALALQMHGLPAIALCGTNNRPSWVRTWLAQRSVIIATDADEAGLKARQELCDWLNLGTAKDHLHVQGVKDVAELHQRNSQVLRAQVDAVLLKVQGRFSGLAATTFLPVPSETPDAN